MQCLARKMINEFIDMFGDSTLWIVIGVCIVLIFIMGALSHWTDIVEGRMRDVFLKGMIVFLVAVVVYWIGIFVYITGSLPW